MIKLFRSISPEKGLRLPKRLYAKTKSAKFYVRKLLLIMLINCEVNTKTIVLTAQRGGRNFNLAKSTIKVKDTSGESNRIPLEI